MGKINILSKHISELIAAGEVVENPASALKEMIENSIDSGASKITVKIKSGGIKEIQVTDNGSGIEKDDIKNAFLKSATSKIKHEQDLEKISTLGFRGEALASICAVSKVEVVTKTKAETYGTHYKINGGEEILLEEGSCPNGTTIIVKDIFYNTPARMKFLKTIAGEGSAVAKVVERISLSHPEISFKFFKDKKEEFNTTGKGTLESAVYSIYGKEFLNNLTPINYEIDLLKIYGYISKAGCYGASRNMQIYFVNKRYVKSNVIRVALEKAFKGYIVSGKFPFCILFLEIPLDFVDVNVHPAKTEVRFGDEKLIYSLVYNAVKDALYSLSTKDFPEFKSRERLKLSDISLQQSDFKSNAKKNATKNTDIWSQINKKVNVSKIGDKSLNLDTKKNLKSEFPDYFSKYEIVKNVSDSNKNSETSKFFQADVKKNGNLNNEKAVCLNEGQNFEENTDDDHITYPSNKELLGSHNDKIITQKDSNTEKNDLLHTDLKISKDAINLKEDELESNKYDSKDNKLISISTKKVFEKENFSSSNKLNFDISNNLIGEIFKTYIILELDGSELLLIDKHAAHERLIYEKLKKQSVNESESQVLIEPIILTFSEEEHDIALNNKDVFLKFGFEIEDFGQFMILVRSAPLYVDKKDIKLTVLDLISNFLENDSNINNNNLEKIYKSMACRSAIKANDITKREELISLVQKMKENNIKYCPHGRPVYVIIKKSDIEKKFFRK